MWVTRYRTVNGCVEWFRVWLEKYVAPIKAGMPSVGPCVKAGAVALLLTPPLVAGSLAIVGRNGAAHRGNDDAGRDRGAAISDAAGAGYRYGSVGGVDAVRGRERVNSYGGSAGSIGGTGYSPGGQLPGSAVWPTLPTQAALGTYPAPNLVGTPPDTRNPPVDVPEPGSLFLVLGGQFAALVLGWLLGGIRK